MTRLEQQTLALAGIFQAAQLVDRVAFSGEIDNLAFNCSFESLFKFDVETTVEIYGDVHGLAQGMQALIDYLGGESRESGRNIAYYVMSMLKIARTLIRDPILAEKVQRGLLDIKVSAREFELSREAVIARIDGFYQDRISNLQPQIMVKGDQVHLQNSKNAAKIRALLLAGIRAAVLWNQLGGNKWKLVLSRKKYVVAAAKLLD